MSVVGYGRILPDYDSMVLATPGLTSYWKLDEASGATTVADSKGAISGSANGSVVSITGPMPGTKGLQMNASSTYLDLGANFNYSGTTAFSVEVWVIRLQDQTSNWPGIMGVEDGSHGWFLQWDRPSSGAIAASPSLVRHDNVGFLGSSDVTQLAQMGSWEHVVGTYDGSTIITYRNAVAMPSASSGTMTAPTANMRIGGTVARTTPQLAGFSKAAIYTSVLDSATVRAHYNAMQRV